MQPGASPSTDDFIVIVVPDQDDAVVLPRVSEHLDVHLGNQRAGRIDDPEVRSRASSRTSGETPCAENGDRAIGHFI
jgi:hypothetical protein